MFLELKYMYNDINQKTYKLSEKGYEGKQKKYISNVNANFSI